MVFLLTLVIFAIALTLLGLGSLLAGKELKARCGGGEPEAACQFCERDGPGLCAKESQATKTLFETTLANPCVCPEDAHRPGPSAPTA